MTDIPLRDYIEQRWKTHKREHAQERAALLDARANIDRRLEGMNELRAQISSERGEYLTRTEYEAKHEALIARINALEQARSNVEGRMWALGGIVVVIQVALAFAVKAWGGL